MIVASVKGIPWSTFELTWCPCQPFLWYLCQRMEESCKIKEKLKLIIILHHFSNRWNIRWIKLWKKAFYKNTILKNKTKVKQWEKQLWFRHNTTHVAHNMKHVIRGVIKTHPSVTDNPWVCLEQYPYPLTALDLRTRTRTTTRTRFSQYLVVHAREPSSFWRENVVAVVSLLRVSARM